jgi:hypothetical protein
MILSRRFADVVSLLRGELDVVACLGMTEDDAVETAMILKLSDTANPRPFAYILAIAARLSVGLATRIIEPGFKRLGLSGRFDGPHDDK